MVMSKQEQKKRKMYQQLSLYCLELHLKGNIILSWVSVLGRLLQVHCDNFLTVLIGGDYFC